MLSFVGDLTVAKDSTGPHLTLVVLNNPAVNPYDTFTEVADASTKFANTGDEVTVTTSSVGSFSVTYQATSSGDPTRPTLTITITVSVIVIDVTAPTVSTVALTSSAGADNTYKAGDVVQATVTFSESVDVTGTPQLTLTVGAASRTANYASGTGTAAIVFAYTVQAGDTDANGISIGANALALNGGTIKDPSLNSATLTHSSVADNASHKVDTTAPTVSSYNPADNATDVAVDATIDITFSETVALGSAGTISLKKTSDNSTIDSWDVATDSGSGAGQCEIVTSTKLRLHLTTSLANSIEYYVVWPAGAVVDAAGNAVAAQSSTTIESFTTVAPSANDTFNPADVANGTLSNGNRTFVQTSGTAIARSITSHSAGKFHVEFTVDVLGTGGFGMFGFSTAGNTGFIGHVDKGSVCADRHDGTYLFNGVGVLHSDQGDASKWAWNNGDVIAVEINLDDLTIRTQNFTQGSGWPVSPTPLFSLAGLTDLPWFIEFLTSKTGGQITLNTGQAAYAVTPTAGFGNW